MPPLTEGRWCSLPVGGHHRYPAGATIFRQGDDVDALFLIDSGAVKLVRSETGNCEAIAALRFPGWLLGVVSAVLDVPHELTAVTVGCCELRRVGVAEFRQAKVRDAGLAAAVERALAEDVHQQVVRIGRSAMDSRGRLLGVLSDLGRTCGRRRPDGSVRLEMVLTQADLAGLILTTREHVNHLLSSLIAAGHVRRERGWLVLPERRRPDPPRRGAVWEGPMLSRIQPIVNLLAGLAVIAIGAHSQADPQSGFQAPTFRLSLDIGRITVRVLDRERRPVRGLTEKDFTVLVDGTPRPILALITEDAEGPVAPTAPWMRDVAPDVATNALVKPRLVVIILDDALTPDLFTVRTAKEVARKAVDQLGPNDLASVVFTMDNRAPQDFTADRERLHAAIDRLHLGFSPNDSLLWSYANSQSIKTMKLAVEFLSSVPDLRSLVLYVTVGPGTDPSRPMRAGLASQDLPGNEAALQLEQAYSAALTSAQSSGVPVYGICTLGLIGPYAHPIGLNLPAQSIYQNLRNISGATGGRAIVADNSPARFVPALFVENSLYYTLGYLAAGPVNDGRLRRIQVRVNRPGFTVEPGGERLIRVEKPAPTRLPVAATTAALSGLVPVADQPLRLAAVALRDPRVQTSGPTLSSLVLALGMDVPSDANLRDEIDIELRVFDGEGRRQLDVKRLSAGLPPSYGRDRQYDFLTTLSLKPGRYNLRVAAHSTIGDWSGSVYTDVTIPDYAKASFSLSDPVVFAVPGRMPIQASAANELLPFPPTTARDFQRTGHATAFVRAYWGRSDRELTPVPLTATITDTDNREVFREARPLSPTRMDPYPSTDYRLNLPVSDLAIGEFVLTLRARTATGLETTKNVRFHVR